MEIIKNEMIPESNGHYSPCIVHNGTVYISGQLPVDPVTKQIPEGIEAQTRMVLDKIDTIVRAAGSSREKIIQVRIYLSDIEDWEKVNLIYSAFFWEHKPVRCVVPVGKLHYGCLIEAEAIACK
jgi:reactive intermediate/imine deaminase